MLLSFYRDILSEQSFLIHFISRSFHCGIMNVYTSRFANVWSRIKQIRVIFTHFKL